MSDPFRLKLKRVWSSWTMLLGLALALLFVVFIPMGKASPWINLVLVVPAVALAIIHWTRRADLAKEVRCTALGKAVPLPASVFDLGLAEDYVDQCYDTVAIEYFISLLTQLPSYLSRVDEDVQLRGRSLEARTTLTFRGVHSLSRAESSVVGVGRAGSQENSCFTGDVFAAEAYDGTLLIPVVRAQKGQLFDNFRVYDNSNDELPTLPQWEVHGLVVVAMRTLFEREVAVTRGNDAASGADVLTDHDRLIILQLVKNTLGAVINRAGHSEYDSDKVELIDKLDARFSELWKERIRSLCSSLATSYLIVVETKVGAGDSLVLGYSSTVTYERLAKSHEATQRRKHGLWPNQLDIHHPWALQADSYHFEVAPHQDMYVYDHHLERMETKDVVDQEYFKTKRGRWYVRLYHNEARPLAHLYIRRQGRDSAPSEARGELDNSSKGDFKSVIGFREIPPGALGNAVTVAFVTAVMVTYFAIFRVGIDPAQLASANKAGNTNQDIPALMLTLPAFLAAAVGRGMTTERVLISSLTAFYGLWTVVVTSLAAVLLYIYSANRILPLEVEWNLGSFKPTFNLIWLFVAAFSVGTLLHLWRRKREEREFYLGLIERRALDGTIITSDTKDGKK